MARLIDTSVIVELERRRAPLSTLAAMLHGEPVAIASITASELLVGAYRAGSEQRRSQRLAFVEAVLREFPVRDFDLAAAREHARISSFLRMSGQSIGAHDLLIAATAMYRNLEVLTENVRHFERVPGIAVSAPGW